MASHLRVKRRIGEVGANLHIPKRHLSACHEAEKPYGPISVPHRFAKAAWTSPRRAVSRDTR
jgi:hypothetical protein